MSQYSPGQQSDNDIRCDTGVPTRPTPEKPLAADTSAASPADGATAAPSSPDAASHAASPDGAMSSADMLTPFSVDGGAAAPLLRHPHPVILAAEGAALHRLHL